MNKTFTLAALALALAAASTAAWAQNEPSSAPNPAGGAMPPMAAGPNHSNMKRVDAELKTAEQAIAKYDKMVRDYKAGRLSKGNAAGSCEQKFQPSVALSVAPQNAKASYIRPAIRYEGCVALAQRLPQACYQLSRMDPSAVAACEQTRIRFNFIRSVRSRGPEARLACREYLTQSPPPPVARLVPSGRFDNVCDAMQNGRDSDEVLQKIAAVASGPLTGEVSSELRRFMDIAINARYDCGQSEGFCTDAVATSRAARSNSARDCGDSVYCRAAMGGGEQACQPLLDALKTSYCESEAARAASGPGSVDPVVGGLRSSYETANAAVVQVVADAEVLEPRNDEDCKERLARARSLRRRLDEVPKWSVKKPAAPAVKK